MKEKQSSIDTAANNARKEQYLPEDEEQQIRNRGDSSEKRSGQSLKS